MTVNIDEIITQINKNEFKSLKIPSNLKENDSKKIINAIDKLDNNLFILLISLYKNGKYNSCLEMIANKINKFDKGNIFDYFYWNENDVNDFFYYNREHFPNNFWKYEKLKSKYTIQEILEMEKDVLLEDRKIFLDTIIIRTIKNFNNYSNQCGSTFLINVVKSKYENYISVEDYKTKYYFKLIKLNEIPHNILKIKKLSLLGKLNNHLPNISKWIKKQKMNENIYEELFKQQFPLDELMILSKVLILEQKYLKHLPNNEDIINNFLDNLNEIKVFYPENCIFDSFNDIFKNIKEKYKFLKNVMDKFKNKLSVYFDFDINNLNIIQFYIMLPIFINTETNSSIKMIKNRNRIFDVIKSILDGTNNITTHSWETSINGKKLIKTFITYNLTGYIFNELIKNNRETTFDLKENGNIYMRISLKPAVLPIIPEEMEGIQKEIIELITEIDKNREQIDITNDKIINFLHKDYFTEEKNIKYYESVVLTIITYYSEFSEKIINDIKTYPLKDKFGKTLKKLIHDSGDEERKNEHFNQMISGCKRKIDEESTLIRTVLQKNNLDDDVKKVLNHSLKLIEDKVIFEELNKNPLIKCVISGEYYAPCDFFTLNCGHVVKKTYAKDINLVCPFCRTKIVSFGSTVISNDNDDLIKELKSRI